MVKKLEDAVPLLLTGSGPVVPVVFPVFKEAVLYVRCRGQVLFAVDCVACLEKSLRKEPILSRMEVEGPFVGRPLEQASLWWRGLDLRPVGCELNVMGSVEDEEAGVLFGWGLKLLVQGPEGPVVFVPEAL